MKYIPIAMLVALASCATPITMLTNGNETVACGGGKAGSQIGGVIGYNIQKRHDRECVKQYTDQGYMIVP